MTTTTPSILKNFDRLPPALIEAAAVFQPAILADVAGRRGALHGSIRALHPSMTFAGTAFTVEVRPGDNLMIHAAIALAQPGDVLVVDGKGDLSAALMGEIMITACRKKELAAVVIDGAVRDTHTLLEMGFPVFAAGTNPNGPSKNIAGRIGHPVSVGGVAVSSGDFICGDADGVVVVEQHKIESLLPLAEKKVVAEASRIAAIGRGDVAAHWLPSALVAAGVLQAGENL